MTERTRRAKQFLEKVLPAGGVEAVLAEPGPALESIAEGAELASPEREVVRTTLEKLASDRDLSPEEEFALEAIIIPDQRPAIDVVRGDFRVKHPLWTHYGAEPIRSRLRKVLPSIGRIEVSGIPSLPYGGTGFVVGRGLLMTNRHVAGLFASGVGRDGLRFRSGIRAGVDFKRERGSSETQFLRVRGVLMIHPYWDMALLEVAGLSARNPPLVLAAEKPERLAGRDVAVVGYPAFDPRNPADVQHKVFGGVYYVKRLQPGKLGRRRTVRSFERHVPALTHDASTLGGNSGSAVVDAASGAVVALHFAGVYLDANFTVPAWELARDERVIEAGVRFAGTARGDAEVREGWWSAAEGVAEPIEEEEVERPTPNTGDDSFAEPGVDRTAPEMELEAVAPWRVAKSLLALRRQVNEKYPRRSKASDGTIGDAAHATRNSDHNPWVKDGGTGVVTAMDVTHDPANGCDAGALAEAIRASRDKRVKYLIYDRRIVSSYKEGAVAAWTWRPYGGTNPHTKHVHVSVLAKKSAYDSEAPWPV